jgi:hypothetical protein
VTLAHASCFESAVEQIRHETFVAQCAYREARNLGCSRARPRTQTTRPGTVKPAMQSPGNQPVVKFLVNTSGERLLA